MTARLVLIRGVGDVGSAVAHGLFRVGHSVVIHDTSSPTTTRRGMAFADAVFDGAAWLEGVVARLVSDSPHLLEVLKRKLEIPVVTGDFMELLGQLSPDVLVDGRMRKRAIPDIQRGLAPLTIGLGPNFIAGETVDIVIETSWGARLGEIITYGPAHPLAGEPRAIGGYARERFVYAAAAGIFRTKLDIGSLVQQGERIARIGATSLHAPLRGMIRGVIRDGVPVSEGTKVIEIDPRGPDVVTTGLGERPRRIAEGVLKAVIERKDQRK